MTPRTPTLVLACSGPPPLLVLADGCCTSGTQRVFWQDGPDGRVEVLRVPMSRPVVMRPVPREDIPGQRGPRDLCTP